MCMTTEIQVEGLLQKAYENLKASNQDAAIQALDEALRVDFDHQEVVYALKCLKWWRERQKQMETIQDCFDRGEFILSQWKGFRNFLERIGFEFERCIYAVRHHVFSNALQCYSNMMKDASIQQDADLLFRTGRCYKETGNYEKALKCLEEAVRIKNEDADLLAELADIYALINEPRAAKALFREAFFINPSKIDIQFLDSEMIHRLYAEVRGLGFTGPELEEWIPVYGVLFGVFSVKRELRAIELGKLKQSIFALENELREQDNKSGILIPRLINRYFWLIDHYVNVAEDPARIDETLLKIKLLDATVHERYTK
jgi:tetratricopeptide (TPR) repeat protein